MARKCPKLNQIYDKYFKLHPFQQQIGTFIERPIEKTTLMSLSCPKYNNYLFPATSFINELKSQKFRSLHQAINIVHKASPQQGKLHDKYRLKSFNGRDIHLFQCAKQECRSHILLKSHNNLHLDKKNKMQFQIYHFENLHNHKETINIQSPQKSLSNQRQYSRIQNQQNQQIDSNIKIHTFEDIKDRLRKCNILNYFRDYINCFNLKKQNSYKNKLPYQLPQILTFKSINVNFRIGHKCLNPKKKTYFFIIEVFAFGNLLTELKFITTLKTKNPQIYVYTLTLLYIILNDLKTCSIFMQSQTYQFIIQTKINSNKQSSQNESEQNKFIKFIFLLENDFFIDCMNQIEKKKIIHQGHIQKHYVQEQIRTYIHRKFLPSDSQEISQGSFIRTDEEKKKFRSNRYRKKIHIKLQELQLKQFRQLNNKCTVAQGTYKQATRGKNGQWHVCQQKPSIIQKLNDILLIQEIKRLKKQKNKEELFCQDANIITLSSDQSDDQQILSKYNQNKQYLRRQQKQYLKHVLQDIFGDDQVKKYQDQRRAEKKQTQERLIFLQQEQMKIEKRQPEPNNEHIGVNNEEEKQNKKLQQQSNYVNEVSISDLSEVQKDKLMQEQISQ